MIKTLFADGSPSSGPLSSGTLNLAVGPTKSARSMAPRSMKMFDPKPVALGTAGSSTRSWPNRSVGGAMIGDWGNPSGERTVTIVERSCNELSEESIALLVSER